MGNLFGGGAKAADPAPKPTTDPVLGPYPDDGAKRMPVANSASVLNAARKKRDSITARSGREATRLVADTGIKPFTNSFLGSVQ